MASAFDPSRFIAAEAARRAREQSLATLASDERAPLELAASLKTAEIRAAEAPGTVPLATLATLAGGSDETLPWAADLAAFVARDCPPDTSPVFWRDLIEEAWDVSRNWGRAALDAGWRSIDLFGCNPDPSARRVDRSGLAFLNATLRTQVQICGIDSRRARMVDPHGKTISFHPPVAPGAVHLWEAYPQTTGP